MKTSQQVVYEITDHLRTTYGADQRKDWYIGIAHDIEERLFGAHNVDRVNGAWIWRRAIDSNHARLAEQNMLRLGYDGGGSGGNHRTIFVYAFRKDLGTIR